MGPEERRRLAQVVICGCLFTLLVAVKLLLPSQMARLNAVLSAAMEQNMDVQAVFSAVGRAFSGECDVTSAAGDVYRAVFQPEPAAPALTDSPVAKSPALLLNGSSAMEFLQSRLPAQTPAENPSAPDNAGNPQTPETPADQAASLAYVLYSDQNLPENVSMQQAILDFDYCVPVQGTLSSGFGYRDHPLEGEEKFHYGLDMAADAGTDILCFADGAVTAVGDSSSYGKYCIIQHAGGYSTLYAHCSRITTTSGASVSQGEKIAEVGETGAATGPHLHFELQQNGTYLNPVYYVA